MQFSNKFSNLSLLLRKCGAAFAIALSLFAATPKIANGSFLLALIVVAIIDHNSCWLNWFWGCPGGDPGYVATVGEKCVSNPNKCGMSAEGTVDANGVCSAVVIDDAACDHKCTSDANACGQTAIGVIVNGSCTAIKPSDSLCEPQIIDPFEAKPRIVKKGDPTTLAWEISNADSCEISGGGLSGPVAIAGSVTTGPILGETEFELTCYGDAAKTISRRFRTRVYVNPQYQEF